jgi:hypothetical protein
MKALATSLAALIILTTLAAGAAGPAAEAPRKPNLGIVPQPGQLQGGDTIETCTVIAALPYYTTGTTSGFVHNYDEACPYTGSTSPDVVYCWVAGFTGGVDIHTCESGYDTKLYVYENAYTPGAYYACNDDNANCPGPIYRSWIEQMPVTMGNTYYIVVDGYGGDFGDYLFNMYEVEGPVICDPYACPPGAFDEGEPDCYDGYEDETNAGCSNLTWSYPGLNTYICGTNGNYDDNTYRDMDWYEVTLTEPKTVNWCVCAEFPPRVWILDGREGCAGMYTMATEAGSPGYQCCAGLDLEPGTYWFIVSIDGWIGIPCGSEYVASLFEDGYSPVEVASWGTIKAMYRGR